MIKYKFIETFDDYMKIEKSDIVEIFYYNSKNLPVKSVIEEVCCKYKLKPDLILFYNPEGDIVCNSSMVYSLKPSYFQISICGNNLLVELYNFNKDQPCVYLIKAGDNYKIGCSKNIKSRLGAYETHSPYNIELLMVYYTYNCNHKTLEKFLHKAYKKQHLKAEWFTGQIDPSQFWLICSCYTLYHSKIMKKYTNDHLNFGLQVIGSDLRV